MKEMIGKRYGFWGDSEKTVSVGADVTSDGRLFQRRHLAPLKSLTFWRYTNQMMMMMMIIIIIINARSPTVDSRVRRITSCMDDDDRRRRRLESATSWVWSERYRGARPHMRLILSDS